MERLYIVTYDVTSQRRWRRVFKVMHGFGEWLQYSVFQCRLDKARVLQMEASLGELINQREDHVLVFDLGPAEDVQPRVHSIGKVFSPVVRESVIV